MRSGSLWFCGVLLACAAGVCAGDAPAGARAASGSFGGAEDGPSVMGVALAPDGARAAVVLSTGVLRLYDTSNATFLKEFQVPEGHRAVFSHDGSKLFAGSARAVLELDAASGKELRSFAAPDGGMIHSIALAPDGKTLAATNNAGIHLWDTKSAKVLRTLTGHGMEGTPAESLSIEGLAFSPDSRLIVSEANDVTARLWNAREGKTTQILKEHDGSVAAVALSPAGGLGASTRSGGILRLWDPDTGRMQSVIRAHQADLSAIVFSSDGRYIFTTGSDNQFKQWDAENGIELRRFGMKSSATALAVSNDGRVAVTVSETEGLTVWELGGLPPRFGTQREIKNAQEAWLALSGAQYAQRLPGMLYFGTAGPDGVAELGRRLSESLAYKDAGNARALVDQLDDPLWAVRSAAFDGLLKLGGAAREALNAGLSHPSQEVRLRAQQLLGQLGPARDLRTTVAIELLGMLATPEARTELQKIATGTSAVAAQARALLARLK